MMVVIGAKGLAKQIYPILKDNVENSKLFFIDTTIKKQKKFKEYSVLNNFSIVEKEIESNRDVNFVIGIGDPIHRYVFYEKMINKYGAVPINIQSPISVISDDSIIGEGNIFLDFSLIECDVKIGNGNLINSYAALFHDVSIGDFNEIMPGAKLLGGVKIGDRCRVGSNATILPGVEIPDNVIIGAGAVVTKKTKLIEGCTYVGVPAKMIK